MKLQVLVLAAALAASAAAAVYPQKAINAAKIFAHECSDCHGPEGRGQMLNQPDFTSAEWQRAVSDERLFKAIKWGKEPMPFYAGSLTDDEISALVRFIRSLPATAAGQHEPAADGCVTCHAKLSDGVTALFARSTHAKAAISCGRCHGGNPLAADKQQAHGERFTGQPSSAQAVSMCGSCHREPLAMFKESRHFPGRRGVARVDCVQCHGAHTVGARRNFSFAYFCAGCHGLEYLPSLRPDLQSMLALVDDLNDSLRGMEEAGRKPTDEVISRRKEIRRRVAAIVHPTDLGGPERIPEILKLGNELKQKMK